MFRHWLRLMSVGLVAAGTVTLHESHEHGLGELYIPGIVLCAIAGAVWMLSFKDRDEG